MIANIIWYNVQFFHEVYVDKFITVAVSLK